MILVRRAYKSPLAVYSSNGYSAVSVARLLNWDYSGPLFRLYEDGAGTEIDIYALPNGLVDTAAIVAHCGANNGLVADGYDQFENGNDVTQATVGDMPKIYDGSSVITGSSGRVAWLSDGVNSWLGTGNDSGDTGDSTVFHVFEDVSQVNGAFRFDGQPAATFGQLSQQKVTTGHHGIYAGTHLQQLSTAYFTLDEVTLHTALFDLGTSNSLTQINKNTATTGNAGSGPAEGLVWGAAFNGNGPAEIRASEIIKFSEPVGSAERGELQDEIIAFYGIA